MEKLRFYTLILILTSLIGCDSQKTDSASKDSDVPQDELHRPSDWHSDLEFKVYYEQPLNDEQRYSVIAETYKTSSSLDRFINQLFDLAFSGDAEIYLPTVLGDPDRSALISPESLVQSLNSFDTVYTENLETGELEQTTIDQSFSSSNTSSLVVYSNVLQEESQLRFIPYEIGVGEQVLNEDGSFRGIRTRYFIKLSERDPDLAQQEFYFLSDSLGIFQLSHMGHFNLEDEAQFFNELLSDGLVEDSTSIQFKQTWLFDSKQPTLIIESEHQIELES